MYLSVGTRPDIAHAVGIASRYLENPTVVHERHVKRILKYLKGTINFGLLYINSEKPRLTGYSDADHAGDIETRRSTSGYVFLLVRSVGGANAKNPFPYPPRKPNTWLHLRPPEN